MEKTGQGAPRLLVERRCLFGQAVNPAVNVCTVVLVGVDDRFDYLPWPLRGGRVVQVGQRLAVLLAPSEKGEIIAYVLECDRGTGPAVGRLRCQAAGQG